jgi:hypothetical protein
MLPNVPEWMPFACLITGRVLPKKAMWTRIIEGALIAALGSAGTLFIGLPIAVANLQNENDATAKTLANHIQWARETVSRRDVQMSAERQAVFQHDAEILAQMKQISSRLDTLYNCVAVRSCTK